MPPRCQFTQKRFLTTKETLNNHSNALFDYRHTVICYRTKKGSLLTHLRAKQDSLSLLYFIIRSAIQFSISSKTCIRSSSCRISCRSSEYSRIVVSEIPAFRNCSYTFHTPAPKSPTGSLPRIQKTPADLSVSLARLFSSVSAYRGTSDGNRLP